MFEKLKGRIFECERRNREIEREVENLHDGIRSVWKQLLNNKYGLQAQTQKSNADILLDCLYECNESFKPVEFSVWINNVKTDKTVVASTDVLELYTHIKKSCGCSNIKITDYKCDEDNLYIDVLQS